MEINDVRTQANFKTESFSGYKKSEVKKKSCWKILKITK